MFVKYQQVLWLFPLVLHVDENQISVKVFIPGYVAIPIGLKVDAFQFWISWGWIQNKKWFKCVVPNNRCWLG